MALPRSYTSRYTWDKIDRARIDREHREALAHYAEVDARPKPEPRLTGKPHVLAVSRSFGTTLPTYTASCTGCDYYANVQRVKADKAAAREVLQVGYDARHQEA